MKKKDIVALIVAIAVCQAAGIIGSFFTASSIPTWYATLTRPDIAPPNWIFAPVWTTLFVLMGIAAYLIWKQGINRKEVKIALSVFGVQLVLNTLWSIIFFGAQSLGWALVEIALLWTAIFTSIILFAKISKTAALLLVPYILWVSFAAYLNYSFWTLN